MSTSTICACSAPLRFLSRCGAWLVPLLGVIVFASGVQAQPSRHDQCLKARDYAGCMAYPSGKPAAAAPLLTGMNRADLPILQAELTRYQQAVLQRSRPNRFVGTIYDCGVLKRALQQYNAAVPAAYQLSYSGGYESAVFGEVETCQPQTPQIRQLMDQLRTLP